MFCFETWHGADELRRYLLRFLRLFPDLFSRHRVAPGKRRLGTGDLAGRLANGGRVDAEGPVAHQRLTGQLEQDTLVGWRGDGHGQFLQWLMVFGG